MRAVSSPRVAPSRLAHFWRPQVLVLRLRDSVVRLGEELEQSAQAEARERENARYFQQRLQDMRLEMEELTQREQDSGRRRMELVKNKKQHKLLLYSSVEMVNNTRCCSNQEGWSLFFFFFQQEAVQWSQINIFTPVTIMFSLEGTKCRFLPLQTE